MHVTIPTNTVATVTIPTFGFSRHTVSESGVPVWQEGKFVPGTGGVEAGRRNEDEIAFDMGSGAYVFGLQRQ